MTEQRAQPQPEQQPQPAQQYAVPPPPPLPPAVLWARPPVRKDRRVLRAVLRWTAAVAVFAAVGTATAYGITTMERTDVPGLATEPDGRWEYPELTRAPLPSGSPAPFADANTSGAHHADLRDLVLPAPEGAKADKALRGDDGWLAKKDFLAEYEPEDDLDSIDQTLTDFGLRHIAARGWTMPDGTHTRIYLLQFNTAAVVDELFSKELTKYNSPVYEVRGAEGIFTRDEEFSSQSRLDDVARAEYVETKPYGREQVRQAYLAAGDTIALIVQSRKGAARAVPFQQTVVLQSQLLG